MTNLNTHLLSLIKRTIYTVWSHKNTRVCDNARSKTSCDLFVCCHRKGMTQWESLPPRIKVGLWKRRGLWWSRLRLWLTYHVVFLISACVSVTLETSFDTESCERQLGVFLNELKQCCIYWEFIRELFIFVALLLYRCKTYKLYIAAIQVRYTILIYFINIIFCIFYTVHLILFPIGHRIHFLKSLPTIRRRR